MVKWEHVTGESPHQGPRTLRLRVDGGWLYTMETGAKESTSTTSGTKPIFSQPVFVSDLKSLATEMKTMITELKSEQNSE